MSTYHRASGATWRGPDDGRDTLHGDVGDGAASLVCSMAPRGETSWPPVTAPVLVPDAPIASIVVAHAEDVYALLAALARPT